MNSDNNYPYKVYHYECDGIDDCGWGCVYRNIQTVISAINYFNNESNKSVPSITDMTLFFGKPLIITKKISMWIEPHQAYIYLTNYFKEEYSFKETLFTNYGNPKSMMFTPIEVYTNENNNIYTSNEKNKLVNEIVDHFKISDIPILFDNGTYSYLMMKCEDMMATIINPHSKTLPDKLYIGLFDWLDSSNTWMILYVSKNVENFLKIMAV